MLDPNSEQLPASPRKSPMKKVAGCVLGAIVLLFIAVFALANYLGIHAQQPNNPIPVESTSTPKSPPVKLTFPKSYLGKWQSKDGTSITIREDGKGDFHSKDTDVSGGTLVIDEKKKILKISSVFDVAEEWKIDHGPKELPHRVIVLRLNGIKFQRVP